MMLGPSYTEGAHVIARRDVPGVLGPLGYPRIHKGTRGIVRSRPASWFSDRYQVEFSPGGQTWISSRYLRPALYGHGDAAFRAYRANRTGVQLGLFVVVGLPALVAAARYYANGGSTSGLIAALPAAALGAFAQLLALVGLPVLLATIVGIAAWRRLRR